MEPLKKDAVNAISNRPDDADMEAIMYQLYVLENMRRGQADVAKGDSIPVEQVLKDIEKW